MDINPGAERVFGHERADVIGKSMDALIVLDVHRARHQQGMKHYLETGEARILERRAEMSALQSP